MGTVISVKDKRIRVLLSYGVLSKLPFLCHFFHQISLSMCMDEGNGLSYCIVSWWNIFKIEVPFINAVDLLSFTSYSIIHITSEINKDSQMSAAFGIYIQVHSDNLLAPYILSSFFIAVGIFPGISSIPILKIK